MNIIGFLTEILFPDICLSCREQARTPHGSGALCNACLNAIPLHTTLLCVVCRARLADNKRVCHAATPLRLASISRYREPAIAALVHHLKYKRHTRVLASIDALLIKQLPAISYRLEGYIVIPVPLHPSRERRRGFNQSLLIARLISEKLNLPLVTDELLKARQTLPQAKTKNIKERRQNLAGSFTLAGKQNLYRQKILLVDDVCTSGTTLIEAANTLKRAGAQEIIGFTLAQTG